MCVLLPSGETRNYINIRKERSKLWDRSGAGVIDPDYMAEIMVLLINTASRVHPIIKGDLIAQLILEKVSIPILKEVKELPPTARGAQGCGF